MRRVLTSVSRYIVYYQRVIESAWSYHLIVDLISAIPSRWRILLFSFGHYKKCLLLPYSYQSRSGKVIRRTQWREYQKEKCWNQNTTTTTTLNCQSLNLTDSQASDILDAYLSTPDVSPVGVLYLNGNRLLTHIPIQINSFTPLSEAFLSYNSFTSIESGLFNLKDAANPLASLYLNSNQLTTIAPGAFKGIHFLLSLIAIKIE